MDIKILSMRIESFKGIKKLNLDFNGKDTNIAADNGVGKTSIFDAFCWCLFDKDSNERADFALTPLDGEGKQIRVSSLVEIKFDIDGEEQTFTKVHKIKEKKIKGQVEKEFQGYTNTYSINDVSMKMNEYKDEVNKLISDDLFKMLTNVNFFTSLKQDKQRQVLFEVLEVPQMEDIIAKNEKLEGIKDLISDESQLDVIKKEAKGHIKRWNDEKKEIPTRIDELERTKIPGDPKSLEEELTNYKKDLDEINEHLIVIDECKKEEYEKKLKLNKLKMDYSDKYRVAENEAKAKVDKSSIAKKVMQLRNEYVKAESEMKDLVNVAKLKGQEELSVLRGKISDFDNKIHGIKNEISGLTFKKNVANDVIKQAKAEIEYLNGIVKAYELNLNKCKVVQFDEKSLKLTKICPTCGKPYTDDEISKVIESERMKFEDKRASKIKEDQEGINKNTEKLEELNSKVKSNASNIADVEKEIKAKTEELAKISNEREEIRKQLEEFEYEKVDTSSYEDKLVTLRKEIADLEAEYNAPVEYTVEFEHKAEMEADIQKLEEALKTPYVNCDEGILRNDESIVKNKISETEKAMAKLEGNKAIDIRIEELEERERELADKIAMEERRLNLITEYSLTKCNLLEEKVNSKFKYISFKLFKTFLGNDNIEECCEATINGVPYRSANKASKVNAGLEIINVLSDFYGIHAPIFIDNAESVNRYIKTSSQIIRLNVTTDKELIVKVVE